MKILVGAILIGLVVMAINTGQDMISDAEKRVNSKQTTKQARVFAEDEFYWDKYNRAYKDIIIKGVNKVFRDNSRCHSLDPQTATKSSNKGTKTDPVFYVTCETKEGDVFNAFFSKSEVESDTSLSAIKHIDQSDAISLCKQYVKANATHPSTVDFSTFMDLSVTNFPNGRTRLASTFTAKNSLNMEAKFDVECMFDGGALIEGTILESQ